MVTISETVKSEIVDLFGVDPDKIVVAPCAVERPVPGYEGDRPAALAQDTPFFLMFNPGRGTKNWEDVIAAFGIYVASNSVDRDTLLVLAGDLRTETEGIRKAIVDSGCADRIVCLGYVTDDETVYLYRNARMSLFPSRYEGSGIPALEAMAHGLPVIVSDIPVMREVTGGAALTIPLDKPASLAEAMSQLNTDNALRTEIVTKGMERIAAYAWPGKCSNCSRCACGPGIPVII